MGGKVVEGQEMNATAITEIELEEDLIPNEDSNGMGLDDVVPCEYVAVEQQDGFSYDMASSSIDGLYDDTKNVEYNVPSVPTAQMVDIAPHVVEGSGNELEEVEIPNEHNTSDDDELDDVA